MLRKVENAVIARSAPGKPLPAKVKASRRKFLRFFPGGFLDETYLDWERDYKWRAHQRWEQDLGRERLASLIRARRHDEVAALAIAIESRTKDRKSVV